MSYRLEKIISSNRGQTVSIYYHDKVSVDHLTSIPPGQYVHKKLPLYNYDSIPHSRDDRLLVQTIREIAIMNRLRDHPNLIPFHQIITDHKSVSIIMPYLELGSMEWMIHSQISYSEKLKAIRQIGIGIEYLHDHGFVHRDIKPENVLTDGNKYVICDFGLSCVSNLPNNRYWGRTKDLTTRIYRAPEIILGSVTSNTSIDIWSYVCLISEIMTGRHPFYDDDFQDHCFEKIKANFDITGGEQKIKYYLQLTTILRQYYPSQLTMLVDIKRNKIEKYLTNCPRWNRYRNLIIECFDILSTQRTKNLNLEGSRKDKQLHSIIKSGLSLNPTQRPNIRQILDQLDPSRGISSTNSRGLFGDQDIFNEIYQHLNFNMIKKIVRVFCLMFSQLERSVYIYCYSINLFIRYLEYIPLNSNGEWMDGDRTARIRILSTYFVSFSMMGSYDYFIDRLNEDDIKLLKEDLQQFIMITQGNFLVSSPIDYLTEASSGLSFDPSSDSYSDEEDEPYTDNIITDRTLRILLILSPMIGRIPSDQAIWCEYWLSKLETISRPSLIPMPDTENILEQMWTMSQSELRELSRIVDSPLGPNQPNWLKDTSLIDLIMALNNDTNITDYILQRSVKNN